jgi:hypothetical protein
MGTLSKDQILSAKEQRSVLISVPEWCGHVYVLAMKGRERDEFEADRLAKKTKDQRKNLENFRATFAARVIVDESGNRIFTDQDAIALGEKSAAALERVVSIGMKLAGMTKEDQDELIKNSDGDPSAASTSV